MTTKNNKREAKGNGKAVRNGIKRETSPAPKSSKANALTLRAWQKTYAKSSPARQLLRELSADEIGMLAWRASFENRRAGKRQD